MSQVKVIVLGNEDFASYLRTKNDAWTVLPAASGFENFWDRVELWDSNPDNPLALDANAEVIIFQDIYSSYDELHAGVAGTLYSVLRYGKSQVFVFGDELFYNELVQATDLYNNNVEEGEKLEHINAIHLPNTSETDMLAVFEQHTSHILPWNGGKTLREEIDEEEMVIIPTVPAEPSVEQVGSEVLHQEVSTVDGAVGNYTEETIRVATQNYNKPANAIPDQLTIAVMSSKGGSGKCLRGDSLVVNSSTGELVTIEDMVVNSAAGETLGFDGYKISHNKVLSRFRSGVKETYTITLASGRSVSATNNHPFLTADGWKELEDLTLGETVATPASLPFPSVVKTVNFSNLLEITKGCVSSHVNGGNLLDFPDEVFSYDKETLTVFLSDIWNKLSIDTHYSETEPSSIFCHPNNPVRINFVGTKRSMEGLRTLFLRLGIVLVSAVSPSSGSAPFNHKPISLEEEQDWDLCVADFSLQTFRNLLNLSFQQSEALDSFLHTLNSDMKGAPLPAPTCNKTTVANVLNPSLSERSEYHSSVMLHERKDLGEGMFHINVDVLKNWGIPSGNSFGDHYGWVASPHLIWDPVVEITADGKHETYDIEIPSVHNFVANNIIVHNSTTAIMLASMIARSTKEAGNPKKVVLVDLDTRDGQVGSLINQYMPTAINIRVIPSSQRTATAIQKNLVHDKNLGIDALLAPVRPTLADDVGPEFYEEVIGVLQTTHDVVIIDCSVNYLDKLLGSAFKVSDQILFVTTLALTSIQGMTRALKEMTASEKNGGLGIDKDKIKIVINQVVLNVNMPKETVIKSVLGIDIVGKIPSTPKAVLIATNHSHMWKLHGVSKLAASYILLVSNCLKTRPHWKIKAPKNIRNIRAIQKMIEDGKLL